MHPSDWTLLLDRIKAGRCTAFLGAGISSPPLPLGEDLARALSDRYHYPLHDVDDLVRVSQYIAVQTDRMHAKEVVRDLLVKQAEAVGQADDWHLTLAQLPITTYLTTNFDPFMTQSLEAVGRTPLREFCRWSSALRRKHGDIAPVQASVREPLVFHLHGHWDEPASMVLTEDDYYDFMIFLSKNAAAIPVPVPDAIANNTLLFVGYGLKDWNLRVLMRSLVAQLEPAERRSGLSVQLPPSVPAERRAEVESYLERYFQKMEVTVFWGTKEEFLVQLRQKWREHTGESLGPEEAA